MLSNSLVVEALYERFFVKALAMLFNRLINGSPNGLIWFMIDMDLDHHV